MKGISVQIPTLEEKLKKLTKKELKMYENGLSIGEIYYLRFLKKIAKKKMEIKIVKTR